MICWKETSMICFGPSGSAWITMSTYANAPMVIASESSLYQKQWKGRKYLVISIICCCAAKTYHQSTRSLLLFLGELAVQQSSHQPQACAKILFTIKNQVVVQSQDYNFRGKLHRQRKTFGEVKCERPVLERTYALISLKIFVNLLFKIMVI